MSTLRLGLQENRSVFAPGELIHGAAQWALESPPEQAAVRLCWFTRGHGQTDAAIAETLPLEAPQAAETRAFTLRAPASPYSFTGQLITLVWAVELVLQPCEEFARLEIVIAPQRQAIVLPGPGAVQAPLSPAPR